MTPFENPVLPGCHPDPSVCRVGAEYFLVTSSFGYFPGIPVYRSTNLATWELIGHILDRPGQVPLAGLDANDGVWAATIRHHEGRFYVVATIARERRGTTSFVVTATDPAGPWSDPVHLEAGGIDPSLFFDDDGRCWYTATYDSTDPQVTGPAELRMREFDADALRLVGPAHVLWHGAVAAQWVEGPHLYRREGRYWLIAAEGGTERHHAVTAASADAVTGPYVTDPRSPLLTHRHLGPDHPVQNVGHADLVDTPDGATWAVTLGVRPIAGTHTLGRETFLVPVEWTPQGPVFAPGTGQVPAAGVVEAGATSGGGVAAGWLVEAGVVEAGVAGPPAGVAPGRPDASPSERAPGLSDPSSGRSAGQTPTAQALDVARPLDRQGWYSLRGPVDGLVRAADDERSLELIPARQTLAGTGTPAFVARRQQHVDFAATCTMTFRPRATGEEAGVAVVLHQDRFATLGVMCDDDGALVRLSCHTTEGTRVVADRRVGPGPVRLTVRGDADAYRFFAEPVGAGEPVGTGEPIGALPREFFATEIAGGFLGVHVGVYAARTGEPTDARASVHDFTYAWGESVPSALARPDAVLATALGGEVGRLGPAG